MYLKRLGNASNEERSGSRADVSAVLERQAGNGRDLFPSSAQRPLHRTGWQAELSRAQLPAMNPGRPYGRPGGSGAHDLAASFLQRRLEGVERSANSAMSNGAAALFKPDKIADARYMRRFG
jgi:hypothetical protein